MSGARCGAVEDSNVQLHGILVNATRMGELIVYGETKVESKARSSAIEWLHNLLIPDGPFLETLCWRSTCQVLVHVQVIVSKTYR